MVKLANRPCLYFLLYYHLCAFFCPHKHRVSSEHRDLFLFLQRAIDIEIGILQQKKELLIGKFIQIWSKMSMHFFPTFCWHNPNSKWDGWWCQQRRSSLLYKRFWGCGCKCFPQMLLPTVWWWYDPWFVHVALHISPRFLDSSIPHYSFIHLFLLASLYGQ